MAENDRQTLDDILQLVGLDPDPESYKDAPAGTITRRMLERMYHLVQNTKGPAPARHFAHAIREVPRFLPYDVLRSLQSLANHGWEWKEEYLPADLAPLNISLDEYIEENRERAAFAADHTGSFIIPGVYWAQLKKRIEE